MEPPSYLIYTSNKAGLRFAKSEGRFIESNEISDKTIQIHPNEKYQEIFGWGGAFTDSTGVNLNSLDEPAQDNLLRAYFSNDGIEYSLCRVPIGGTDFSERGYSYDDGDEDPKLENFQLAPEDFKLKVGEVIWYPCLDVVLDTVYQKSAKFDVGEFEVFRFCVDCSQVDEN